MQMFKLLLKAQWLVKLNARNCFRSNIISTFFCMVLFLALVYLVEIAYVLKFVFLVMLLDHDIL
jgi:hypothetical protein